MINLEFKKEEQMKKLWKRGLSLFVVTLMLTSMLPNGIMAEEANPEKAVEVKQESLSVKNTKDVKISGSDLITATDEITILEYQGFQYQEDQEGIMLISYNGVLNETNILKIPEKINENNVIKIGKEAFKNNTEIKEVVIPKEVTEIDETAFNGCTNLEKITVDVNNVVYLDKAGILYLKGIDETFVTPEKALNTTTDTAKEESVAVITEDQTTDPSTQGTNDIACTYQTHVENVGWQGWQTNGAVSGTSGKSLRLEGIKIKVNNSGDDIGIEYQTHVENIGWQGYKSNGEISGTSGKSLRLEAIQIKLTGAQADKYDIYYQVHAENYGWLGWAKNGESAGTEGYAYRLEAIKILVVPKGSVAPGTTNQPFVKNIYCSYQTHVQNIGWQGWRSKGDVSGTSGEALRLEGIEIKTSDPTHLGVSYQTQVQNIGWQNWKNDGVISGTSGKSLRLEAIKIKLTGADADKYDIYYQVHAEDYGWLDWAKNGENAGTEGLAYRLEAIRIVVVPKGTNAPGATENPFISKEAFLNNIRGDWYDKTNRVAGPHLKIGEPNEEKGLLWLGIKWYENRYRIAAISRDGKSGTIEAYKWNYYKPTSGGFIKTELDINPPDVYTYSYENNTITEYKYQVNNVKVTTFTR